MWSTQQNPQNRLTPAKLHFVVNALTKENGYPYIAQQFEIFMESQTDRIFYMQRNEISPWNHNRYTIILHIPEKNARRARQSFWVLHFRVRVFSLFHGLHLLLFLAFFSVLEMHFYEKCVITTDGHSICTQFRLNCVTLKLKREKWITRIINLPENQRLFGCNQDQTNSIQLPWHLRISRIINYFYNSLSIGNDRNTYTLCSTPWHRIWWICGWEETLIATICWSTKRRKNEWINCVLFHNYEFVVPFPSTQSQFIVVHC